MQFVLFLLLLAPADTSRARFEQALAEGLLALGRGDLQAADRNLALATRLDAKSGQAWLGLAEVQAKLGSRAMAEAAAQSAFRVAPQDPKILHGLALLYAESGRPGQAAEMEARYAAVTPLDTDAPRRAADLFLAAGNAARALELAASALHAEDTAKARNVLGKAYEANGQTGRAVIELQEAIKRNEYEESYYFDLANVLLRHQNFEAAIQLLEASRRTFARSAQLELALGVAYYAQRRFTEAVATFLKTISIDASIPQPYVFLGRILEHAAGRMAEVVARFSARAQRNPQDHLAQHLYGKALAAQGEVVDIAEAALRRSIALKEDFWESHYELGLILEKSGNVEGAAKELERAVALNPTAPVPHYRLARVYDRLGRREEAGQERALHQKLSDREKAAIEKHASGIKKLEIVIK